MGADIAVQLARCGHDVAVTARDQARLDAVADEVRAAGGRALAFASDLTDRRSTASFADAALAEFGRCDVLCNNGIYNGPGVLKRLMESALDELVISFEADVVAPVLLCQRAIPSMLANGGGTIVNMSSSTVFLDPPGSVGDNGWSFVYVAAKAGIDQLASIINVEHGAQGIRAFTVEPGFVAYGEDLGRMLRQYPGIPVSPPEAIGPAVVWLVQDEAAGRFLSKRVNLPALTVKHDLLPDWDGPGSDFESARS
jgi:NAD(P)-dependent dehydrogenase (short-subunit alcohol dehydrogenase family)